MTTQVDYRLFPAIYTDGAHYWTVSDGQAWRWIMVVQELFGDMARADISLQACAPFSDEWNYFSSLRELGPLAAHYAGVENGLLKSVWPYPRSVPDFARPGARIVDWGPWVDTARLYEQLLPAGSGRLESLVAAHGVQPQLDALAAEHCPADRRRYHAALYDALAGALLLAALARDAQVAGLSMMQLLALSTLDPRKRDALQQTELF